MTHPAESSLTLEVESSPSRLQGEWKVRVMDLSFPLRLDLNHDGVVRWPQIEHRRADIQAYLGSHIRILANGARVGVGFGQLAYGTQDGEPFILARLTADVTGAGTTAGAEGTVATLGVNYSLPSAGTAERCHLKVIWPGEGMQAADIFAASGTLTFTRSAAAASGFQESLQQGIWHIWTGYDHILFLIVLLIPAVFHRTPGGGREAVPTFTAALLRVVIIVSAFTVAHSITLACAAMEWVRLPSRLVESVIAASILIAALNNLLSRTAGGRSAELAFAFGLIHGFGFAGALSEIGADGSPLWRTLLAFNGGVEAGQLAIVAVFLPIAYLLRRTRFYQTGVLLGGSTLAGLCALLWFWERAIRGSA